MKTMKGKGLRQKGMTEKHKTSRTGQAGKCKFCYYDLGFFRLQPATVLLLIR